jgi:hypothetical protein
MPSSSLCTLFGFSVNDKFDWSALVSQIGVGFVSTQTLLPHPLPLYQVPMPQIYTPLLGSTTMQEAK